MSLSSLCTTSFYHQDFDVSRVAEHPPKSCPVAKCSTALKTVPYRKKSLPYCPEHGLQLHQGTFVYFNGAEKEAERRARLRNFTVAQDWVIAHVLDSEKKAETHRLGYEMSEDALSWNVFVSLLKAGHLRTAAEYLTDRAIQGEPELYLWGMRPHDAHQFEPLRETRRELEPDIHRYPTEPDIMLVVPGKLVVCVEAKFSSGNVLTTDAKTEPGEKPRSAAELVRRYLGEPGYWKNETKWLARKAITGRIHSQLFRNVAFAIRMAESRGADWHVVNLVSSTQWKGARSVNGYGYDDPSSALRSYLTDGCRDHFTFRHWEGLYRAVIKDVPALQSLQRYLLGKSAHYQRAFALD